MTFADRVLEVVDRNLVPLTDDEIAAQLGVNRSQVNSEARFLVQKGELTRSVGPNGKLVNRRLDMRFVVYPDKAGEWRWRLLAANNRIVAASGESFDSRSSALRAAENVYEGIMGMPRGGDVSAQDDDLETEPESPASPV